MIIQQVLATILPLGVDQVQAQAAVVGQVLDLEVGQAQEAVVGQAQAVEAAQAQEVEVVVGLEVEVAVVVEVVVGQAVDRAQEAVVDLVVVLEVAVVVAVVVEAVVVVEAAQGQGQLDLLMGLEVLVQEIKTKQRKRVALKLSQCRLLQKKEREIQLQLLQRYLVKRTQWPELCIKRTEKVF